MVEGMKGEVCLRGVHRQNRAQWHGPSYLGDQDKKPSEPRDFGQNSETSLILK